MHLTRFEIIGRLLGSYRTYYDITLYEKEHLPLRALCEYYEQNEKYMVSKKVNLWTVKGEEFIYLYEVPELTLAVLEQCLAQAKEAGSNLAHVGPGHMYTYITPVFVCDTITEEARKALQKFSMRKAFSFSLQGWLIMQTVAVEAAAQPNIYTNSAGKEKIKNLKKIFSY